VRINLQGPVGWAAQYFLETSFMLICALAGIRVRRDSGEGGIEH
jgi:hypothetical protein